MTLKTKKILTVCALVALITSLCIPTAYARSSTATVTMGISSMQVGSDAQLKGISLRGTVTSTSNTTNGMLVGYLCTKGKIFSHIRDMKQVNDGNSTSLYWGNPGSETGYFFAKAQAPDGNQSGNCVCVQYD